MDGRYDVGQHYESLEDSVIAVMNFRWAMKRLGAGITLFLWDEL
jgi:hypothetical protein